MHAHTHAHTHFQVSMDLQIHFVTSEEVGGRLIDNVRKLLANSKSRDKQVDALTELLSVNQWSNLTAASIGKLQNVQECVWIERIKFH